MSARPPSIRSCLVVVATVALAALTAVAIPEPAAAAYSSAIPAGTPLVVQDQTDTSSADLIALTSMTITTTTANQIRRLRGYLSITHTRTGTATLPDRFYTQVRVVCTGATFPPAEISTINVLANSSVTHAPRILLTFPVAGTYTCTLQHKITTSRSYSDTTDNMTVRTDGYLALSDPLPSWSKQCYWPKAMSSNPDCDVTNPDLEIASRKINSGATLVRTPVVASIPRGTVAYVYADALVSTCGGSGGGDSALCGDDLASGQDSTVVSYIKVDPVGTTRSECRPTFDTAISYDHYERLDIAVKTHHAVLYHALRITTTTDSTCPTTYRTYHQLTAFSNTESVVVHQDGTLLFVSP